MSTPAAKPASQPTGFGSFRRSLFRGLAVILPPLLTILVFLWAWGMIDTYILTPTERIAGQLIVWTIRDVKSGVPDGEVIYRAEPGSPVTAFEYKGRKYVPVGRTLKWIPETVQATVEANPFEDELAPTTAGGYYEYFVRVKYLRRERTVPLFLAMFLLVLYLTGKFMAAGVGRFVWRIGESIVQRMPIVRNVYAAVKQVTDYLFSEQEVQFLRVVAVEYPRKGLWTIAFVTGDSFRDIKDAAGEPVLSLLVPTSPMPATGFTCTGRAARHGRVGYHRRPGRAVHRELRRRRPAAPAMGQQEGRPRRDPPPGARHRPGQRRGRRIGLRPCYLLANRCSATLLSHCAALLSRSGHDSPVCRRPAWRWITAHLRLRRDARGSSQKAEEEGGDHHGRWPGPLLRLRRLTRSPMAASPPRWPTWKAWSAATRRRPTRPCLRSKPGSTCRERRSRLNWKP